MANTQDGWDCERAPTWLIPYKTDKSKYELVLLIVWSRWSVRNSECVTRDANANVSAELPPGCGCHYVHSNVDFRNVDTDRVVH